MSFLDKLKAIQAAVAASAPLVQAVENTVVAANPNAANAVQEINAVAAVANSLATTTASTIDAVNATGIPALPPGSDPAAMAAQSTSVSTDPDALNGRITELEAKMKVYDELFAALEGPLETIFKHHGLN